VSGASEHDQEFAGLVLLPAVTTTLFMHGMLGVTTSSSPVTPAQSYGLTWAAGIDTAFTLPLVAATINGRPFPRALGGMEMALTAPQIAVAAYGLRADPRNTLGYGAIAGWSGLLFAHGLVSVALPREKPRPAEPAPPPKPPLLVPASIELAPTPVAGGGGLTLAGRW
jgi:hypothetical protein